MYGSIEPESYGGRNARCREQECAVAKCFDIELPYELWSSSDDATSSTCMSELDVVCSRIFGDGGREMVMYILSLGRNCVVVCEPESHGGRRNALLLANALILNYHLNCVLGLAV